jgi:hypothetical protein
MNHCDYDHETNEPIKAMPTGGGAHVQVCFSHYLHEMKERSERNKTDGVPLVIAKWDELEVTQAYIPLTRKQRMGVIEMQTVEEMIAQGATPDEAEKAHALIEILLPGLRIKPNGRIDTTVGDKTPLGLYRFIKRGDV